MTSSLNQQIQQFYDASSNLWEQIWGEHMHHGYYGADGTEKKERRQAQIDLIEELLLWAEVSHASHILDVGCGIGGSSLYLAQKFQAHTTGITLSPVQAKRGSDRARETHSRDEGGRMKDENASVLSPQSSVLSPQSSALGTQGLCQFLVADALNMPFADESFDFVWSLESGEHMPDKTQFLQECCRVLKPGGTLLMATWCHRPIDHRPLTPDEERHLQDIYRVYCLPHVISLPQYEQIARSLPLNSIRTADWSPAVAPFWDVVIDSAITPNAIFGLLTSGWTTIQAALSLRLMKRGYERGLVRFGLLTGVKAEGGGMKSEE